MLLTGRLCIFIILVSFYVRFFYFEGAWKYNFVLNPYMFHHVIEIGRAVQQECRDRSLACISYAVFCLKKKKRLAEGVGKLVMIQDHPQ